MMLTQHSCTLFLLLSFGFIDSRIFENSLEEENGRDQYLFFRDKALPIESECRHLPESSTAIYAFQIAVKNFLFDVKQETMKPDLIAMNDSLQEHNIPKVTVQRCKKNINPDGNCLFRSISYCLYKDERFYRQIRAEIVNHVVENWDEHYGFYILAVEDVYSVHIKSVDEYENYMGKDSVWGGQFEVMAAASVYKVCAKVFSSRAETQIFGEEHPTTIGLLYSGDGYIGHYSVLEDVPLPGLAEPTGFTIDSLPTIPVNRYSSPQQFAFSRANVIEDPLSAFSDKYEPEQKFSTSNITNILEEPMQTDLSPPTSSTKSSMHDTSTKLSTLSIAGARREHSNEINWPQIFRSKRKHPSEVYKPSSEVQNLVNAHTSLYVPKPAREPQNQGGTRASKIYPSEVDSIGTLKPQYNKHLQELQNQNESYTSRRYPSGVYQSFEESSLMDERYSGKKYQPSEELLNPSTIFSPLEQRNSFEFTNVPLETDENFYKYHKDPNKLQ